MKKSRSVQMIQRDPLIGVGMIASRSAMKIVASDFRNTKRTGKSYKFLASYDFGSAICNAWWWWRWIPATEDTTNGDDGVTIGEPSIHSIGLLFGFSHSRFVKIFYYLFQTLDQKKTHLQDWEVEDEDDEDGDGDSAVCCLLLSTCHRLEGSSTSDLSTKNTHLCPAHQARPTLPLLRVV